MAHPKTAVLTGAAGLIGRATAHRLVAAGITVHGIDIDADALDRAAAEVGPGFVPLVGDLATEAGVTAACDAVLSAAGPVGILINNVGILTTDKFLQTTLHDLRHAMALNFETAFLASQRIIPGMVAAGGGRIVNVSSFAGRSGGLLAGTAYSLSKAAMIGLTFSLAREFGPRGISTNAVAPAFVRSEMMARNFRVPGDEERLLTTIPLRRLCDPDEVASAIAYLVSPAAGFINGEVLDINGGVQCD
ncbi:MAG: SDR family oxidoreductase [Rhodobacteraceae bacterium]|nr:SDR family oxidoreductase [Paracoccaceae bacterium]